MNSHSASAGPVRFWFGVFKQAANYWLQSQAFIYAAALAFFTVFSMAPIIILAVTVVGLVFGEQSAREQLSTQLEAAIGPEANEIVQTAVANSQIDQSGLLPTVLGILAMLIGATTLFAQMQQALNRIWEVVPRPSRSGLWVYLKTRLLSLTVVLIIGFVLLVSLLISVTLSAMVQMASQWLPVSDGLLFVIEIGVSIFVITLLFGAIFKILPDVRIGWKQVLLGGFLTAVLFTFGRYLIALYLATTAAGSAYGAAGSLALLLLWVNYSALILLFGAAFTRAQFEAQGSRVVPRNGAVRVHRTLGSDRV